MMWSSSERDLRNIWLTFVCHLGRMRKYRLKMNPIKCAFGVSAGRFLGFIVHEGGIQVDLKNIDSINKLAEPVCKKDVQKLLGKINYLRCFISNLAGRVESFLPLIRLKHNNGFTWSTNQKEAFKKIKEYLSKPSVLRAPKVWKAFRIYVAAQSHVIRVVLTQEEGGKEFMVAYVSHRLGDAKTRYANIKKLCLSLYYACAKF
jgi:hypothetical protein